MFTQIECLYYSIFRLEFDDETIVKYLILRHDS